MKAALMKRYFTKMCTFFATFKFSTYFQINKLTGIDGMDSCFWYYVRNAVTITAIQPYNNDRNKKKI